MQAISKGLRRALKNSKDSRYRIALQSKGQLNQSELSQFVKGRKNLGLAKLDCLADLLGLEVVTVKKRETAPAN